MKKILQFLVFLLLLYSCNNVNNGNYEICRFYLTAHSGGHLGMTQIYDDGTIRVYTGWQGGLYGDTLLHLLFNNVSVSNFDGNLFREYHEQGKSKLSDSELNRIKCMLSDVSNNHYVIQETEDDVFFAWIGVIIAGEEEWSFYDDEIDSSMEMLFDYLRELSVKVLENKSKTGNSSYPFLRQLSPCEPKGKKLDSINSE